MESRHHPGPDICCVDQDSRLLDRRVLAKFFAITTLILFHNTIVRLIIPAYTDSVKRWNFRKADWKRFCLLAGESVANFPPPDKQTSRNYIRNYATAC